MSKRSRITVTIMGALALTCAAGIWSLPSAAANHLVKIRYVISHRSVLLGSLPSYIAQDKGYFAKNGVDVQFLSGGGGGTTLRLLSTGNVEIAEGGLSAAILAAKTDPRIELVGDWYHSANVMVWIAPSTTHVHSVSDLKGAKLGYSRPGSASQRLSQLAITAAGIKDVKFVSVGGMGDNWAAAKGGVITAGWAMEPFLSEKIQHDGAKIVLAPAKYIKHFYIEGIDVNKEFAHKHPAAIKGVFKALAESVEFIKNHTDEATEIATKHYKASRSVLKAGIESYLKEGVWDMKTDPKAFETVMQGMIESGQLDHAIDLGKLMNQNYLPARFRTPFK